MFRDGFLAAKTTVRLLLLAGTCARCFPYIEFPDYTAYVPGSYRYINVSASAFGRKQALALEAEESSILVTPDGSLFSDRRPRKVPFSSSLSALEASYRRQLLQDSPFSDSGSNPACYGCIPNSRVEVNDTTAFPFVSIGRLLGRRQGASVGLQCTGTLIGRRHVLTAAHCVFDITDTRIYLASLDYSQAQNGSSMPFQQLSWTYARIPAVFAQQDNYSYVAMNADFALVTLSQETNNSNWMTMFPPATIGSSDTLNLTTAGYPQELPTGTMWTTNCSDATIAYTTVNGVSFRNSTECAYNACQNLFIHTCAATTGQSGSAMWDRNLKIRSLLIGKVSVKGGGPPANIGLTLSSTIYTRIINWYNEDANDSAGALNLTGSAAPAPLAEPRRGGLERWLIAFITENAVLAGVLLAGIAGLVLWRTRRAKSMPSTPEPSVEMLKLGRAAEEGHSPGGAQDKALVVEGTLRPVWDKVGVVEYSSGDRFTGELCGEWPSGYGVGRLTGTMRTIQYEGQWIEGRQHGWGTASDGTHMIAGRWEGGMVVNLLGEFQPREDLATELDEAMDLCEEASRMARAAAKSALESGVVFRHAGQL